MRIEIKTKHPVKDRDFKALYLLDHALRQLSTSRMREANLRFVLEGFHEGQELLAKMKGAK